MARGDDLPGGDLEELVRLCALRPGIAYEDAPARAVSELALPLLLWDERVSRAAEGVEVVDVDRALDLPHAIDRELTLLAAGGRQIDHVGGVLHGVHPVLPGKLGGDKVGDGPGDQRLVHALRYAVLLGSVGCGRLVDDTAPAELGLHLVRAELTAAVSAGELDPTRKPLPLLDRVTVLVLHVDAPLPKLLVDLRLLLREERVDS